MLEFNFIINLQLFAEERTEPATAKRRREAKEKGQVAKSKEIVTAVLLLATFLSIRIFAKSIYTDLIELIQLFLAFPDNTENAIQTGDLVKVYGKTLWVFAKVMTPTFFISILTTIVFNYLQVGFIFTLKPLIPKFNKINPIEGFKNIFSKNALVELLKSTFKIGIIGYVFIAT